MRKIFETIVLAMVLVLSAMSLVSCMTTGEHDVELQMIEDATDQAETETVVPVEEMDLTQGDAAPEDTIATEGEATALEGEATAGDIPGDAPAVVDAVQEADAVQEEVPATNAKVQEQASYSKETASEEDLDAAVIGNVVIPKWFMYISSGLFLATLMAICYVYNQRRKAIWYGRRE